MSTILDFLQRFIPPAELSRLTEHLEATPERVERAWSELLAGYREPSWQFTTFPATSHNLVVQTGITFYSLCAHHLLPFFGEIDIGYIPGEKIVGISKLIRSAQHVAARLQVQEDLTSQILEFLNTRLQPRGVIVVVRARHLCQEMRGVKSSAMTMTSAIGGLFRDVPALRDEFFSVCRSKVS